MKIMKSLLAACATAPVALPQAAVTTLEGQRQIELAGMFLTGSWRSIVPRPGEGDPTPTRLILARIWPDIPNEYWIYAEYLPPDDARPSRQRLYRLREEGGRVVALTYALPGKPGDFAGEWSKENPFAGVKPGSLRERANCRILIEPVFESTFKGRPVGSGCAGDREGVATETTAFDLTSVELSLWTQGFDASGKRVVGEAGPLELRKMSRNVR
jgi:CpeT/CpcT family (DUF1001)